MVDRTGKLSNASRVRKKKATPKASVADLSNGAPVRKKRGRPPKGDRPLTPAEHQKAYRERKKAKAARDVSRMQLAERYALARGLIALYQLERVHKQLFEIEYKLSRVLDDLRRSESSPEEIRKAVWEVTGIARELGWQSLPWKSDNIPFRQEVREAITKGEWPKDVRVWPYFVPVPDLPVEIENIHISQFAPPKPSSAQPQPTPSLPPLPKGLRTIDAALQMDFIICLEDGKKVQDLAAHLAELGMTPDEYRAKWGLPAEYPMKAPRSLVREGETFEYDPDTGTMRHAPAEPPDFP